MLTVENIEVFYGKVQALFGVSLEVGEHEIVSVIGSNGAGKTTTMKSIVGLNKVKAGKITYNGKVISNQKPHRTIYDGIVYVPEGREVFPDMPVVENLEMGAFSKKYTAAQYKEKLEEVYELFPRLRERAKQKAGTLSGGEQQMLAIARGLMSEPKLLMLDEPSMGLAPLLVEQIFDIIRALHKSGTTILLVEQNAQMALSVANRAYVLETGKISMSGDAQELLHNDAVRKAYLGA